MKVRELLATSDRWIQGDFAKDINGKSVNSLSDDAVCWCLAGAINFCVNGNNEEYWKLYDIISMETAQNVVAFNETHTYEEVIAMLNKLDI